MKELPGPNEGNLPARVQYVEMPPAETAAEPGAGGLVDYWRILRRRKGTIFLFALAGVLGAVLFSLPQTPVYQGKTTLEILNVNDNVLNSRQVEQIGTAGDYTPELNIQTQVKILQSESLIGQVLAKMRTSDPNKLAGETTRISAWRQALGLAQPTPAGGEKQVQGAIANLKVSAVARTRLVEVRYDSPDPRIAADFLNALSAEFIDQNIAVRWETSQKTGDWLARQIQDMKIKLERAEDELQRYARSTNLIYTGEKDSVAEEKLKQVQAELSSAQGDRTAKQSKYELASNASPDSLPEILDDRQLGDYQAKLTDLRRQMAELSAAYTPAHYKVKQVQAQIEELTKTSERQRANVLARIRNEYDGAQRREKLLARDYAAQSKTVSDEAARAVHYNILKREVDTNRQLYEVMLQRVKEYGIASAMQASNVRVVDAARPPRLPYKPNYPLNSGLGLLSGLFLGVMFVVIRERADRTIQSPGDTPFYLEVPELGVIPCAHSGKHLGYYRHPHRDTEGTEKNIELVTARKSGSAVGESFRAALTSILFTGKNGDQPRVIVLTSPGPKEGKTTVASNLGLALAEIHRRVLLIDADLRKPRLHEIFHLPNDWGLSDVLQGTESSPFHESLVTGTGYGELSLIPAGSATNQAGSLVHSPKMAELLAGLRQEFDTILIDTPPMLTMVDARVLGRLADGVILVVRSRQTTREMAQAAAQRFEEDGTPLIGTILNDWNPKATAGGYYGYYRGYSYRSYYAHYYHKDGENTEGH